MRLAPLLTASDDISLHAASSTIDRSFNARVKRLISSTAAIALILTPTLSMAQQLPSGGSVAAGSASISSPNANTLNINQSSNRAVINWQDFSVARGNTVNFNQPDASSATLNRVTGATPSSIAGAINAPGTVLLVNPNGIAITRSGVVNTGSFAASTLNIKDNDFMSGNYTFTGNGASASVTNAGRINVSDGGFAALLGGRVANDGVISARLGKVGLGSGELMTLDIAGDGFLSVAVPTLNGIVGADGKPLVSNRGKIKADGGTVYLSAATAAGLLRDAVHVPGSIRANSVGTRGGKIVIGGGDGGKVSVTGKVTASSKTAKGGNIAISGAEVAVSGKLAANGASGGTIKLAADKAAKVDGEVSAKGSTGKGGEVIVTADAISAGSTAKFDVSGAQGGLLLIGGDYQGGVNAANNFSIEPVKTALMTAIAAGTTLNASGSNGDGGKIVVWADDHTRFDGHVNVGASGGKGGFAEVSGHNVLDFTGTANLAGTAGAGTLLLDPRNVIISNGANANSSNSGGTFTPGGNDSVINVATLQAALASGNVIVTTGGAGSAGSQAGDITVASNVTWSANRLTLQAYRSIFVNAEMSATGTAALTLTTNNGGSGGTITYGGNATFANTTQSLIINGATYTLIDSMSALQNINNSLSGNYALIKSLDASSTASWVPIGTNGAGDVTNGGNGFAGNFTGLGNTISNLTINKTGVANVGLFGYADLNSSVANVNLLNAKVTGAQYVGALVGQTGGNVTDAYVSGSVTGSGNFAGGVVGLLSNHGSQIADVHADVTVRGNIRVGGVIGGVIGGNIIRSSANGTVTGNSQVGGLVGLFNDGTISNSYSTASATGSGVGGLVGFSAISMQIATSWASGAVTGSNAGGLVGSGTATFTDSYWDTQTSGQAFATGGAAVAGATGLTTAQIRTASSYVGLDLADTWYMVDGNTRPFLRSEYSTTIANAHQLQLINMNAAPFGASYKIANDINIGKVLANTSEMWGAKGWVAIGTDGAGGFSGGGSGFKGTFDGQYHFIDGLTINRTTAMNGLFGYQSGGTISKVGLTNVNIVGGNTTGALVGWTLAGSVSDSFATGLVSGGWQVGGLVGQTQETASLLRTYAQVRVVGTGDDVGGLVGQNGGTISQSYAAGSVTAASSPAGLTANNGGTVTDSYYDSQMFGGTVGAGTALTTTQMKSGLQNGFDAAQWGIVTNWSYAYLKGFYPTAPQVIIGDAYTTGSANPNAGAQVNALINGVAVGTTYAGASGAYTFLLPTGSIATNSQVVTYTTGANGGMTHAYGVSSNAVAMSGITAGELYQGGAAASVSEFAAGLAIAVGSSGVSTNFSNRYISARGADFEIDQSIVLSGNLVLSTAGNITQRAGAFIDVNQLRLSSVSSSSIKNFTLLDTGNRIRSLGALLAANGGSIQLYSGTDLTIGNGVTAGNVLIQSAGALTLGQNAAINASGTGDAVVLVSGSTFANARPSNPVSTPNGRWLVYAATPTGSIFGGMNSNNHAVFNSTYANNAPSSIASGNRYVFAIQPTLTFTSTDASKLYGTTADLSSNYTVSSSVAAVANAFTVDTTAYTGTPTLTSDGAAAAATVAGGPYAITIGQGSLSSNYALNFVSSGKLTITPASLTLTITPNAATKVYGNAFTFAGTAFTPTGLANGDTVSSVSLASLGAIATAGVGSYDITASNAVFGSGSASNYNIVYNTLAGGFTVTQRSLIITANSVSRAYGDANPLTGTATGNNLVNGDTITGVSLTSTANATSNVGGYNLTGSNATGSGLENYAISYAMVTSGLMVTRRNLTITANGVSRVYGDANPLSGTATGNNLVNGDTIGSVSLTSPATAGSSVGRFDLTASNAVFTSGSAGNYNISYATLTQGLTVTARPITITADDRTKTYGSALGTNGGYTVTSGSLVNGDEISQVTMTSNGLAGTASVGSYAITPSNAAGSRLGNYAVTYVAGTVTVNPANLVITAADQSKYYGNGLNLGSTMFSRTPLFNSDTVDSVTLTSAGAGATGSAGTHAIVAGAAQGTGLSNYNITYVNGALTVNKATLVINIGSINKTYGDELIFSNQYTPAGLKNSDAVTSVSLSSAGAAATANAGNYAVTGSNAQGTGLSNYNISYQQGSLSVLKATLTITANNQTKGYGSSISFAGTEFQASGLKFAGDVASVALSSAGADQTANAGGYFINASNAAGPGVGNYNIYYNAGSLNVTRALLTVTATNQSKVYGDTAALGSTGFTVGGTLYNNDSVTGVAFESLGGAPATANVGGYSLFVSGATGTGVSNYAITYVAGILNVTPRPITITANDRTKTYGQLLSGSNLYSITSGNLVNGNQITSVSLASTGFAANAGVSGSPYSIVSSNAQGSGLSNYAITYVNGSLTVNRADLVITANDTTKGYGQTLIFNGTEFSTNGLKNGETVGQVQLASAGAASAATVAGGPYAITASNASGGTFNANNYNVSYVAGAMTVTPASLTLTITPNAATKVYGDAFTFAGTAFNPSGLVNGDTVSSVSLASLGAAATAGVGRYDITASNAVFGNGSASNYNIVYNTLAGGFTVTPRSLVITANGVSRMYGDANPATGTANGNNLVNGDTITGVTLTSSATTASGVGSYSLTGSAATGSGLDNYSISYATVANGLTVTPRSLIITANSVSRVYGDANPTAGTATGNNLVNGDSINGVTLASSATTASGVGSYSLTGSAATGNGLGNYSITYATVANGLTVTPRSLIITANSVSRIYGDANPTTGTATGNNLVNGDTISGVTLASQATTASGVGSYSLTGSAATGTGLGNYSITYATVANGLTVTPRSLVITANGVSRVYGDANPNSGSAIGNNLVNGDAITGVTLTSSATTASGVGGHSLTGSAATGTGLGNYSITYATVANGLTVTPRALVITANGVSRAYGEANPTSGSATGDNLVNGDSITSVSLTSPATTSSNVGTYALTASNAIGSGLSNYAITYATVPNGLTVSAAALTLTITPTAISKIYGNAYTFNGTEFAPTGLTNGDTISRVTLTSAGAAATAGVGQYDITASNAVFGSGLASNYNISYNVLSGGLTVTPRSLVITANSVSRVYGDANPVTGTATGNNLVNGDTITGVTLTSSATTASGVGSYSLTGSAATGAGLSNYNISYAIVADGLTVTPRSLVITASSVSRVYGDANPTTGNATGNNLVNGDIITGVTLASSATIGSGVGGYSLTGSAATGTGLGNYSISYATVANGLTVTPRSLVITANGVSRTYGDANPTDGTATGDNLTNGDTITGVTLASSATGTSGVGSYSLTGSAATGTGLGNYSITYATVANGLTVTPRALVIKAGGVSRTYGDVNPVTGAATGDNLVNGDTITGVTLVSSATTASGVGSYALTGTHATGTGLSNYAISYATVANGLTVTPRSLVITANDVSRIYGDANPTTGAASGDNLVNGDTITGVTLTSSATTGSGVGSYSLTGSNATGSGLSNYTISYATSASGLTVTPRALVVTADSVSRIYGNANPINGTASGDNLVNGDTISGVTLASVATAASGVGSYGLTGSNAVGTGLGNYSISYATVANGLTVTPRALVITADSVSRIYGDANPSTGSATGDNLVNGDTITGVSLASAATAASGVGSYGLSGSNAVGFGLGNYSISYATVANGLTVTPRALVIAANAQSKTVGDLDPLLTYRITSGNLVNGDGLSGTLARLAGESAGDYAILKGTVAASANYSVAYIGADFTILAPPATTPTAPTIGLAFAASRYGTPAASGSSSVVNISFQPNLSGTPVISVRTPVAAAAPRNTNIASVSQDVGQNIAPSGGQLSLFLPISQFDKLQYSGETLPAYAPEAAQATVLTMIARAGINNRVDPRIDALWNSGAAAWTNVSEAVGKTAQFGDGKGTERKPAGDNGFAFVNATTDLAALLKSGPVMLGGAKADGLPGSWLLALQVTADGKSIIANDPATGRPVVLAYDAATKTVGAVTGVVEASGKIVPMGDTPPQGISMPAPAWSQLKAFAPVSYFAVTL